MREKTDRITFTSRSQTVLAMLADLVFLRFSPDFDLRGTGVAETEGGMI